MGQASRSKKERHALRRSLPAILEKVEQQRRLLGVLGEAFDAGHELVGLSLATTIRVLVHNTSSASSLLHQADLEGLPFRDTSLAFAPGNLLPQHPGLVIAQMTMGTGSAWIPRGNIEPPTPGAEPRDVPVGTWWTAPVTRDSAGRTWSRRKMVLDIANKEGGAHVDPDQPIDVRAIEEQNSMGFTHHDPIVGDRPMINGPLLPSIRQIARELEVTLDQPAARSATRGRASTR